MKYISTLLIIIFNITIDPGTIFNFQRAGTESQLYDFTGYTSKFHLQSSILSRCYNTSYWWRRSNIHFLYDTIGGLHFVSRRSQPQGNFFKLINIWINIIKVRLGNMEWNNISMKHGNLISSLVNSKTGF